MKWFRNLKISAKLIIAFLLIALIAGGVGAYGTISLLNSNAESDQMVEDHGNSQGYLGFVLGEFNNQRALYRDIIMYSDDSKTGNIIAKIKTSSDTMIDNLKKYKQTCKTENEIANYTALETAINDYVTERDKVIVFENNGNYMMANQILRSDNESQVVDKAETAIYNAIAFNGKETIAAQQNQDAVDSIKSIIMVSLSAAAVVLAILFGLFLTKIIAKPIKMLSSFASKVAEGITDIEEAKYEVKDEIGDLVRAFQSVLRSINEMVKDTDMLTEAAIEGKLTVRADSSKHQGEYRKIVEGINGTLDAIVAPIKEAMDVIKKMSHGSLEYTVEGEYKGDFASFKEALNHTVEKLKLIVSEISYTLGEMSKGNLDVEITTEYHNNFTTVRESINGIAAALNNTMMEIKTAADQVLSGSRQVSDGNQAVSQGATEQASSIEELTATITQIAQQTKQNAMSANNANELTVSAVSDAVQGNEQMKAMQQAMSDISESSQNISKIIKVIDDIAFQTNILALNAAVEAARAGVHGKGFAVVAEEVRNLAARSANAAKETTDLIEGSIKKTEAGTKIADETAGALSSIVKGVEKAAQLVSEIARASNEQAGAITQVNNSIEQMSQVVQTNSATAEEGAAASEELSSQAELLKNTVGTFRFKAGVEQRRASEQTRVTKATGEKSKSPVINMNDDNFGKY